MITRSADSRTAILDAAELLFAQLGFAAATIKKIGLQSGQNTALIYYYFANKATLYRHVLERVFAEVAREGASRTQAHPLPSDVIRAVVESQVTVLARRPHLSQLIAREVIDWQAANAESSIRALNATLFDRLCRAIEEGQSTGQFRSDLRPRFAAISIIAQVAYLLLARPVVGILLGRGTEGPTADDVHAFGQHAVQFALEALKGNGTSPEQESVASQATRGGGS